MSGALRLKLFGGFRLELADGTPIAVPLRKAEALLAYLALAGEMLRRKSHYTVAPRSTETSAVV